MCLLSAALKRAAKSLGADWSVKGGRATVEGLCPSNGCRVLLNAPRATGLMNITKSTVQFAMGYPDPPPRVDPSEEKGQLSSAPSMRMGAAAEGFYANAGVHSVGRWQLGPGITDPRPVGVTTAGLLRVRQPSSQVSLSIVT